MDPQWLSHVKAPGEVGGGTENLHRGEVEGPRFDQGPGCFPGSQNDKTMGFDTSWSQARDQLQGTLKTKEAEFNKQAMGTPGLENWAPEKNIAMSMGKKMVKWW